MAIFFPRTWRQQYTPQPRESSSKRTWNKKTCSPWLLKLSQTLKRPTWRYSNFVRFRFRPLLLSSSLLLSYLYLSLIWTIHNQRSFKILIIIQQTICIALGIEQATLRHRGDKGIAWLTQLMDVIDVLDYPVPGYTPSTVLSELHVHVWDCAVDYRYEPVD